MTNIDKLRMLIWDKEEDMFTDPELEEFMEDARGNAYRAAVIALRVIQADPDKLESFSRGGVAVQYQDIEQAVAEYEKLGGNMRPVTVSSKRVFDNETTG